MKGGHKILVKSMTRIKDMQKKRNDRIVFISTAIATFMSPPTKMLMISSRKKGDGTSIFNK